MDPIPISAVVTLPPSSLSPPPRVFALHERVHPIFPGITKHCPPCPSFFLGTRRVQFFFVANRALLRYYIRYDFAHLITATWTLLRQLISVLMFLISRISLRLYRVHYRDKYTRHIWHRDSANDSINTKLTEWLTDRNDQRAQVRDDDVYVLGRRERWHLCDWQ